MKEEKWDFASAMIARNEKISLAGRRLQINFPIYHFSPWTAHHHVTSCALQFLPIQSWNSQQNQGYFWLQMEIGFSVDVRMNFMLATSAPHAHASTPISGNFNKIHNRTMKASEMNPAIKWMKDRNYMLEARSEMMVLWLFLPKRTLPHSEERTLAVCEWNWNGGKCETQIKMELLAFYAFA